jgi:hypothetical protein
MAYTTVYKGIIFIEGDHPSATRGFCIECDLSFKIGAQLKSLRDVKDKLVEQVKNYGYNTLLDFTYGQKSRWLAIDDVAFWGKGCLANIPPEEYTKMVEALSGK